MSKGRRYDIDGLRVIVMLAVFVFPCTRLFDTEDSASLRFEATSQAE